MTKPTRSEYAIDVRMCMGSGMNCCENFEAVDVSGAKNRCSNCKVAFERKKQVIL